MCYCRVDNGLPPLSELVKRERGTLVDTYNSPPFAEIIEKADDTFMFHDVLKLMWQRGSTEVSACGHDVHIYIDATARVAYFLTPRRFYTAPIYPNGALAV